MAIDKHAIISQKATIGERVSIGAFSIIHDGVVIGDDVTIGAYSEIGIETPLAKKNTLVIGSGSTIRSHAALYTGSDIGAKFSTGHYVCVRENSVIGEGVQIGSRGDIQGDCSIGDYTKMHADVHVGKASKIGKYVWLFPEVLLTNDPTPPSESLIGVTIEDYVVVAAKSLLMPGVTIQRDAVVSAASVVTANVDFGAVVKGSPAKKVCDAKILRMHDDMRIKAYPWRYRFTRGYPEEVSAEWLAEKEK